MSLALREALLELLHLSLRELGEVLGVDGRAELGGLGQGDILPPLPPPSLPHASPAGSYKGAGVL